MHITHRYFPAEELFFHFKERLLPEISAKQKKIFAIVSSIFALLAMAALIYRFFVIRKTESANADSVSLQKGYMIIPFLKEGVIKSYVASIQNFFSQPEDYQSQFAVKGEIEIGYSTLPEKKCYVVRHQQVPEELKPFVTYASTAHQLALKILSDIEKEMDLAPGIFSQMVSKTALPGSEKSPSVLRLFSYHPSTEEGLGALAHEDLGVLTIIPRSQVPALEVLDVNENKHEWINIEKQADASEAIVLVGQTLCEWTEGKYPAATHRVIKTMKERNSIVYQLRADPTATIKHNGTMMTIEEWMKMHRQTRKSVNGSYGNCNSLPT